MREEHGTRSRRPGSAVLLSALAVLTAGCIAHVQQLPVYPCDPASPTPTVDSVPYPAIPPGLKVVCPDGPETQGPAPECPVLRWNSVTYWPLSHIDNRNAVTLVAYDRGGGIVNQLYLPGARYVWRITVEPEAETVTLWGQANNTVAVSWDALAGNAAPSGRACYWLNPRTNGWESTPYPSKRQCFDMDSCDGGRGRSSGGCYKWAAGPNAPREPWDELTPASHGETITVTEKDNGATLEVSVGDELLVVLDSNATTGYHWHLAELSDPTVLEETGSDYHPDPNPGRVPGRGGREEWRFAARQRGTAQLRLEYIPPAMSDSAPGQTFRVSVVVR